MSTVSSRCKIYILLSEPLAVAGVVGLTRSTQVTSTETAIYNPTPNSPASSQLVTSATAPTSAKWNSFFKQISKVYEHAKSLYASKELVQAYNALQPLVTPSNFQSNELTFDTAPVADAKHSQRVKVWSLYCNLVQDILATDYDLGTAKFSNATYEYVKSQAEGTVWDYVIQVGYGGRLSAVDSATVIHMSVMPYDRISNMWLTMKVFRLGWYASMRNPRGGILSSLRLGSPLLRVLMIILQSRARRQVAAAIQLEEVTLT